MNCFEARNDFVALWQKTLAHDRRGQLLAHLRECAGCDRSFRIFALTAPVLHSASEPEWKSELARPTDAAGFESQSVRSVWEDRIRTRRVNRLLPAFVMAVAAVVAVYYAAPSRMTFEDAIATDNSNVEVASYPSTDSFLGQELIARDTSATDTADE
jgi:hypothetical protein